MENKQLMKKFADIYEQQDLREKEEPEIKRTKELKEEGIMQVSTLPEKEHRNKREMKAIRKMDAKRVNAGEFNAQRDKLTKPACRSKKKPQKSDGTKMVFKVVK